MFWKVVLGASLLISSSALAQSAKHIVEASIRNSGDGWHVMADADHAPSGIASVDATADSIVVHFDFKADKIGTFLVGVDETYARMGFTCGASVDLDHATIQCSRWRIFGSHVVDPTRMTAPMGDLWIYGSFQ